MSSPLMATRTRRHLVPAVLATLAAAGIGVGVVGSGTAFAQGVHRTQVGTAAAGTSLLARHERRESPSVRASETTSNDPVGTNSEPTDVISTDPSPNDENASDTSVSDVNDVTDSVTSSDQSSGTSTSFDGSPLKLATSNGHVSLHHHHR